MVGERVSLRTFDPDRSRDARRRGVSVNLGAGEVLLLAILALIVFGPKRLPEIGKQVGRAVAEIRRVSREFEAEVRDVAEPFVREVREAAEPIEAEVREAEQLARRQYLMDDDHSTFVAKSPEDAPKD